MSFEQFNKNPQSNIENLRSNSVSAEERRYIEQQLKKEESSDKSQSVILSFFIFKNGNDLNVEEYMALRKEVDWFQKFEKDLIHNDAIKNEPLANFTKDKCRTLIFEYYKDYLKRQNNDLKEKDKEK